MEILYSLAGIRNPVMTPALLAITQLGSEIAAIAVSFILYWCFDKRKAYFLITNVMFGTAINQTVKFFCRVPRPFARDPEFEIVEAARADAGGYSFPSGHTTTAVAIFGSLAVVWKNKMTRFLCILVIALIGFSRVYLGVHYLSDVLGGLACGLIVLAALYALFRAADQNTRMLPLTFGIGAAVTLILALVLEFTSWDAGMDAENWAESVKNLNVCFGCLLALAISEPLERKKIRFETGAIWWVQILKIVLGFACVMALRAALKPAMAALFGNLGIATAIRYFLVAIFALDIWPLTFRWFSKLGMAKTQNAAN